MAKLLCPRAHGYGAIELCAAVGLVAMPWVAGFASWSHSARNFYVASGLAILAVWALTDYTAAAAPARGPSTQVPGHAGASS